MKLPRRWWLVFPVLGSLASLAAPSIYASRHVAQDLQAPVVVDASIEHDLACAIEARCGPLRAPATITLLVPGAEPTVDPPGVLPPGYAGCAAEVVGTQITGALRLVPCAPASP